MSSRKKGRAGIIQAQEHKETMRRVGEVENKKLRDQMQTQFVEFSKNLESYAFKHKDRIQTDPRFRAKFHQMCNKLGVDPLTSQKGIWSKMLGLGDFYFELGVRIIDVCVRTRPFNGGFIALPELLRALQKRRTVEQIEISEDDIERAVSKLAVLGSGFKIIDIGSERMVRSVPVELSGDHTTALGLCRKTGVLSHAILKQQPDWDDERVARTLQYFLDQKLAWLDTQGAAGPEYWILGLVPGSTAE
jgi:ESCRT-II complex subunit VPS22